MVFVLPIDVPDLSIDWSSPSASKETHIGIVAPTDAIWRVLGIGLHQDYEGVEQQVPSYSS